MNPITMSTFSSSAHGPEAGRPQSLAERVLGHPVRTSVLSTPVGDAADAGQEQGDVIPLPGPVRDPMPELAAIWARQMFIELMMTGDEEETGVPPLSIDF